MPYLQFCHVPTMICLPQTNLQNNIPPVDIIVNVVDVLMAVTVVKSHHVRSIAALWEAHNNCAPDYYYIRISTIACVCRCYLADWTRAGDRKWNTAQ